MKEARRNHKSLVFHETALSNKFEPSNEELNEIKVAMLKVTKAIPEKRKVQYKINALVHEMEDYLKNDNPNEFIPVGSFLKESIKILNVKNKEFAEYIGMEAPNLSAVISGKRKLNLELADIFGQLFNTDGKLWLQLQIKNDWMTYIKTAHIRKREKVYSLDNLIH